MTEREFVYWGGPNDGKVAPSGTPPRQCIAVMQPFLRPGGINAERTGEYRLDVAAGVYRWHPDRPALP